MPKLLVFAPCEKVIISQDENNPTLIAVLTEMGAQYHLESGAELPENISLPMRWAIFSMWQQEPRDAGKSFRQRIEFWSPANKQMFKEQDHEFTFEKPIQRVVMHLPGFPAGNGVWTLKTYIAEKDAPFQKEPIATYPIIIKVVKTESSATT